MSCCDAKGETPEPAKQAPSISDGGAAKNESLIFEPKEVPLSLSSLAHAMCLPRDENNSGVLEGLLSVVHHTLCEVSCHSSSPIQATSWTLVNSTNEKSPFKDLPYTYAKHSYLFSSKEMPKIPQEDEEDWAVACDKSVVGRISLYYACSDDSITEDDDGDMQQALLMRALVEYRSQPSKGSSHARKQEELSLTSFGNGSVDDDVKLGALSSLYDSTGKYVLKITSVRNMTYVYNVSSSNMASSVSVSQEPPTNGPPLTRLELSLDVKEDSKQPETKPLSFPSQQLEKNFLVWNAPRSAMALPSQQTLLLDKQGMYINGRLFENTELLPPPLFGSNLEGVPAWHGRIQDLKMVQQAYATLWQEIMIDARLVHLNIASTLLARLMNGIEDDDDEAEEDVTADSECLESILMASAEFDPVGICAKALGTRFAKEFGVKAVPCLSHEVEWFQERMAHKTPVVVPQRLLNVLRRGGYFDLQRETQEVWFMENVRPPGEGEESAVVEKAMELLKRAGANDVTIMFVKIEAVVDPVKHKYMCRYNDAFVQYHVNDSVLKLEKPAEAIAMYVAQEYPDGHVLLNLMCSSE